MGNIGSINFITMDGVDIPQRTLTESIDRLGVDGMGIRTHVLRAEELTIFTVQGVNDIYAANTAIADYAALKGTKVTVVEDLGRSVSDVMVVNVRVTKKQKISVSSPAGTGALVYAAWQLKPTA